MSNRSKNYKEIITKATHQNLGEKIQVKWSLEGKLFIYIKRK